MSDKIIPYPSPSRSDKEGKPRIPFIPENLNERALRIIDTCYHKRKENLL